MKKNTVKIILICTVFLTGLLFLNIKTEAGVSHPHNMPVSVSDIHVTEMILPPQPQLTIIPLPPGELPLTGIPIDTSLTPVQISGMPLAITPTPVIKKSELGILILFAYTQGDYQKKPYQGTFYLCNQPDMKIQSETEGTQPDIASSEICRILSTSKGGHAMIKLPPGYYYFKNSASCLPGKYCITDISTQVIFPNPWQFNPQSFYLPARQVIHAEAVRHPSMILDK